MLRTIPPSPALFPPPAHLDAPVVEDHKAHVHHRHGQRAQLGYRPGRGRAQAARRSRAAARMAASRGPGYRCLRRSPHTSGVPNRAARAAAHPTPAGAAARRPPLQAPPPGAHLCSKTPTRAITVMPTAVNSAWRHVSATGKLNSYVNSAAGPVSLGGGRAAQREGDALGRVRRLLVRSAPLALQARAAAGGRAVRRRARLGRRARAAQSLPARRRAAGRSGSQLTPCMARHAAWRGATEHDRSFHTGITHPFCSQPRSSPRRPGL